MTRDLTGVQTWHDYAARNDGARRPLHGNVGAASAGNRAGQSTRTTTWITAEGQRVREESYALLTARMGATDSASWLTRKNRWVKRTAGNGRITERELMCDRRLLWDIDENGVRMDLCLRRRASW